MAVETTYTSLRERLASVLDQVANDREVVIVRRRRAQINEENILLGLPTIEILAPPEI